MFKKMFAVAALSLFAAGGANAQTAADNIRPSRQVCLAGQPCVGNKVSMANEVAPVIAESMAAAPMAEVAASSFDAETTYMTSCFACHSSGAAGAPKVGPGNADAWTTRLEKGMDQGVTNAIAGINNMPPKGLCFTCNDDDIKALVEYMVDSSK